MDASDACVASLMLAMSAALASAFARCDSTCRRTRPHRSISHDVASETDLFVPTDPVAPLPRPLRVTPASADTTGK